MTFYHARAAGWLCCSAMCILQALFSSSGGEHRRRVSTRSHAGGLRFPPRRRTPLVDYIARTRAVFHMVRDARSLRWLEPDQKPPPAPLRTHETLAA